MIGLILAGTGIGYLCAGLALGLTGSWLTALLVLSLSGSAATLILAALLACHGNQLAITARRKDEDAPVGAEAALQ